MSTGPQIIHYQLGGPSACEGELVTIDHVGIVAGQGVIDGKPVVPGTIISVKKQLRKADALVQLAGDKKLVHRALDHRRSLANCREDVCGEIQQQMDGLQ